MANGGGPDARIEMTTVLLGGTRAEPSSDCFQVTGRWHPSGWPDCSDQHEHDQPRARGHATELGSCQRVVEMAHSTPSHTIPSIPTLPPPIPSLSSFHQHLRATQCIDLVNEYDSGLVDLQQRQCSSSTGCWQGLGCCNDNALTFSDVLAAHNRGALSAAD